METNRIIEIKNSTFNTSVFYNNHEVWISSIDSKNDIAQVLDLQTGETYVVHCRKLTEQGKVTSDNNSYNYNSFY
jgi:H-type small acid-soluble spore protein